MLIRLIKQDEISFQLRLRPQKKEIILFRESRTLKTEFWSTCIRTQDSGEYNAKTIALILSKATRDSITKSLQFK